MALCLVCNEISKLYTKYNYIDIKKTKRLILLHHINSKCHTRGLVGVVGDPALLFVEGTYSRTGLNLFLTWPGDDRPDNDWVNFRLREIEFVNVFADWDCCKLILPDLSQAFELFI